MSRYVEITRQPTPLVRQRWVFWPGEGEERLCLSTWVHETRATTDAKWEPKMCWLPHFECELSIPAAEVPIPDGVLAEVLETLRARITIGFWSREGER